MNLETRRRAHLGRIGNWTVGLGSEVQYTGAGTGHGDPNMEPGR